MHNEMKILILDDDPDDAFLAKDALGEIYSTRYDVDIALNVQQANEMLEACSYATLLCDYRMGASNGVDFIRSLRSRNIMIPSILLTGMSDEEIDAEALAAGASEYLNKSDITGALLDKTIRYAVANAARHNLMSTVLSNVESAICVIDQDGKPGLWNEKFSDLAKTFSDSSEQESAIEGLLAYSLSAKGIVNTADRILEQSLSVTDDGRSVLTLHDVTAHVEALREREEAENRAGFLAKHCSLTGLPNRLGFNEKIDEMIAASESFQLLNLDLNGFKEINDVFGHETGDAMLEQVSDRLRDCCGNVDFLARIGGDEFVILQSLPSDKTELARSIELKLNQDFMVSEAKLRIGVSIGVSTFPDNGDTPACLLSNADIAMYRAKTNPTSNVQFYDKALDNATRERRALIVDLKDAIANEQIEVYFQPQADVLSNKLLGFEALARWFHPVKGFVSPDIFILLAEENGLIEDLGRLVLRKACTIASAWPYPVNVAVNVSGVQIRHSDLLNDVRQILLETGLPTSRLELEVTESVLLGNMSQALHVLRGLKSMGIALAMDDFGTGYSSLSSLISFPFDKLKIDRSFVTNMDKRDRLRNVVKTCIGLGKNFEMRLVAEGVEKLEHVEFLAEHGCQEMQGFLIGRPLSPQDAENYLLEGEGMVIFGPDIEQSDGIQLLQKSI